MNSGDNRYQRVYAKINLDALEENFKSIAANTKTDTRIMAVLKTDAYGHGAIPIARTLEKYEKLYGFALATAEEALILRNSGITRPLLILGYTFPNDYEELILKNISLTVFKKDMIEDIVNACRKLSSTEYKYCARVHIKVDTGMGRIGISPDDNGLEFVRELLKYPEIKIEGIFSHLSTADEADKTYTNHQIAKFSDFTQRVEKELGIAVPIKHLSNSAGIIEFPEINFDIVRAGVILYGLWPSSEVSRDKVLLRSVLSLHSQIVFIKDVKAGTKISYGGTFTASKDMKVATVPVGYGEGYPRSLSNKGAVLVKGIRCPILGRICMDQFMIDVSNVPDVKEYDHVTLIGSDGAEQITMEELGDLSGRFNYEMACDLGKRIPRVFTQQGRITYTKDYYQDF